MNKKISLTIGISAYNEALNIANLLDSILQQKRDSYDLDAVIVACDGCTDDTAEIVKKHLRKDRRIRLIDDGQRLGKLERLNRFYQRNESDIYLSLDGDILLGHDSVIENIIKAFDSEKVGLVAGNDIPCEPRTFSERIVVTGIRLWYEMRKDVNGGDTIHNYHSCVSALRSEVCKKIHIPKGIVADDDFVYFRVRELGYKFQHSDEAIVYYRAPDSLQDFIKQSTRYLNTKSKIIKHFGWVTYDHYEVPRKNKMKALRVMLLREPVFLPLALLFQFILRICQFRLVNHYEGGPWEPITSTKAPKVKGLNS